MYVCTHMYVGKLNSLVALSALSLDMTWFTGVG